MSADTIPAAGGDDPAVTQGDNSGGGAGRGGAGNSSEGPLVVVQQPRAAAPPRPAARRSRDEQDNSLRNGYAAISHSVSGETAAIGIGFALGGPVGAIIGGAAAPVAAAAIAWRARRRQHDENANRSNAANGLGGNSGTGSGRNGRGNGGGSGGGRGRNNGLGGGRGTGNGGRNRNGNGAGGGRGNGRGGADGTGKNNKPKTKDPVADKLGKLGKDLADKFKNRDKTDKVPKNDKGKGLKGDAKKLKDKLGRDKTGKGKTSKDDKPWSSSPDGLDPKAKKDRKGWHRKDKGAGDDTSSSTARDGLDPKAPKGDGGADDDLPPKPDYDPDEYVEAELVDDDEPARPDEDPLEVIDAEVVDEDLEDRIALIKAKREKARRRQAIAVGKKAGEKAARQGTTDPKKARRAAERQANARIDAEIAASEDLLALAAGVEKVRKTGMTTKYPAVQAAPIAKRQEGAAVARQISTRDTQAFAILRAMADQLANGLHNDDDADMADHIVELTGIPNMCRNLSTAVRAAAEALRRTAPLSPKVMKHLTNAAVAARTAAVMSDQIMVIFVEAHREDIIRVLDPRLGEERWNIRNARGTLDAAKLRAAIASAHQAQMKALPAGASAPGGSKLVPASDGSTKKLVGLMKGFTRGHMVNVLSEVAGTGHGVDLVANSVTKLYKRMTKTWPTERIVDDTVLRTASAVRRVSTELKKAVREAQKAHERELRLNAKGRAGKGARADRKWDVVGRLGGSSN